MRPKFRNREESNIYFLSQRKVQSEKKAQILKKTKIIATLAIIGVGGYFLSS